MRKETTVTIAAEGRDTGKVFKLVEMPAMQAEKWATRALLALMRSGVEVPDNIASAGLAGVATMGVRAFGGLAFADAEPLLDEMLTCCAFQPDPNAPFNLIRGPMMISQIEEVSTILRLREEVLSLHLGFSIPAYRLKLMSRNKQADAPSLNTATSPTPSGPSSPAA